MLSFAVAVLTYLTVASSRETVRPMPTITNSLVNLGKMEIAFYFNGNGRDTADRPSSARQNSPFFFQKPEVIVEEPCPCSSLRNIKDSFLSNPTGLLNKILMNNDLFSFNKEPLTSTLCCESHEHVQEGTVVFEFPTNPKNMKPFASRSNTAPITNAMPMPMMPFLFDTAIPNKSMLPPMKTKSIEIFLFPKKKEQGLPDISKIPKKKDLISKDNIQIVGDKELKNNISLFKPVYPVVKKDLTRQEENEKQQETEKENIVQEKGPEKEKEVVGKEEGDQIIIEPASKPNAV